MNNIHTCHDIDFYFKEINATTNRNNSCCFFNNCSICQKLTLGVEHVPVLIYYGILLKGNQVFTLIDILPTNVNVNYLIFI